MTGSEERYSRLNWNLRAYAEGWVRTDWSNATDADRLRAQKLAFAIEDFSRSVMKSLDERASLKTAEGKVE